MCVYKIMLHFDIIDSIRIDIPNSFFDIVGKIQYVPDDRRAYIYTPKLMSSGGYELTTDYFEKQFGVKLTDIYVAIENMKTQYKSVADIISKFYKYTHGLPPKAERGIFTIEEINTTVVEEPVITESGVNLSISTERNTRRFKSKSTDTKHAKKRLNNK